MFFLTLSTIFLIILLKNDGSEGAMIINGPSTRINANPCTENIRQVITMGHSICNQNSSQMIHPTVAMSKFTFSHCIRARNKICQRSYYIPILLGIVNKQRNEPTICLGNRVIEIFQSDVNFFRRYCVGQLLSLFS